MSIITVLRTTPLRKSFIKLPIESSITISELFRILNKDATINFDVTRELVILNKIRVLNKISQEVIQVKNIFSINIFVPDDQSFAQTKFTEYVCVPSQYQKPYNSVSNQCSWFASESVKEKFKLLKYYKTDLVKYKNLYTRILDKATKLREQALLQNQILVGENIDQVGQLFDINHCLCDSQDISTFMIMFPEMELIIRPNSNTTTFDDLCNTIKHSNNSLICNRFGQSFCAIRCNNDFLILDSHIGFSGIMSPDNLIDYIVYDNIQNNYVLWATC